MTQRLDWRTVRVWVPVVLWVAFIWGLGSDVFSHPETSRILRPLIQWLIPDITAAELHRALFLVRKLAHATEYALLAIITLRAVLLSSRVRLARALAIVLALGALLAAADEVRQTRSPVRTGSGWDVLLDLGGVAAVLLAALVVETRLGRVLFRARRSEVADP